MNGSLGLLLAIGLISNIVAWRLQQVAVNHTASFSANPRMAVMEYAPGFRIASGFLVVALMGLVITVVYRYGQDMAEVRLFFSLTLVLLACGSLLLIEVLTRKVVLTADAIGSLGRLSRKAVRWSDVESISFNQWSRMIVVHAVDGDRLRINPSLSGMEFLEFMASENLDSACYSSAFRQLKEYLPAKTHKI